MLTTLPLPSPDNPSADADTPSAATNTVLYISGVHARLMLAVF